MAQECTMWGEDIDPKLKLKTLRERRPPWPRQIITPILPTLKMLSLGGERLSPPSPTPPPPPKKKTKRFWILPAPRSGYATTIMVFFFAHLLIWEYPDHHQNVISSSLYCPGPLRKISSQSIHNRQTNQRYQKHNLLCQGGNYSTRMYTVRWRYWSKSNIIAQECTWWGEGTDPQHFASLIHISVAIKASLLKFSMFSVH